MLYRKPGEVKYHFQGKGDILVLFEISSMKTPETLDFSQQRYYMCQPMPWHVNFLLTPH